MGLENLISIGGAFILGGNYGFKSNPALSSLSGLESLTSVGGDVLICSNDALMSLTGVENLEASTIEDLYVIGNHLLGNCHVLSICEYLTSPNGYYYIEGNAPGCNSPEEEQDSCEANAVNLDEHYFRDNLLIYPNPSNRELNISAEGFNIDEVVIYTLTGLEVFIAKPRGETINISTLPPGMYIVEVTVEGRKLRQKLLVQR